MTIEKFPPLLLSMYVLRLSSLRWRVNKEYVYWFINALTKLSRLASCLKSVVSRLFPQDRSNMATRYDDKSILDYRTI